MTLTTPYGTLEMTAQEAIEIVKALLKDAPQDVVAGILAIPGALLDMIKGRTKK